MESEGQVVFPPCFRFFHFSQKILGDNAMSQQALATQVALAQYVQQVQQANQAQVKPLESIHQND